MPEHSHKKSLLEFDAHSQLLVQLVPEKTEWIQKVKQTNKQKKSLKSLVAEINAFCFQQIWIWSSSEFFLLS